MTSTESLSLSHPPSPLSSCFNFNRDVTALNNRLRVVETAIAGLPHLQQLAAVAASGSSGTSAAVAGNLGGIGGLTKMAMMAKPGGSGGGGGEGRGNNLGYR